MDIFDGIKETLVEILDIEDREITPDTYIIRELDAESIDLLELAVSLNAKFEIDVNDDEIFLKTLRMHMDEGLKQGKEVTGYLKERFPSLKKDRLEEIIADLEAGPALKVKDLISYIKHQFSR